MATILKEYPRLFTYEKGGKTYYRVDLRDKDYPKTLQQTKDFSDEQTAREYRRQFQETKKREGINAFAPIQSPRLDKLDKQCAIFGYTVEDAVKIACDYWFEQKAKEVSPYMAELLDKWVERKQNGFKPLRADSKKGIKNYAGYFKAAFGKYRIKEVSQNQQLIENYLKDKGEPQTQFNHANYLAQFFKWAMDNNYCSDNPAAKLKRQIHIPIKTIQFYSVEQTEQILRKCLEPDNAVVIGVFALGLFCGSRPKETSKLTWESNIKWETREVFIPHNISKTKRDRLFKMSDTLFAWLSLLKSKDLPLIPKKNLRRLTDKVTKTLSFKTIKDGLRHTYATLEHKRTGDYITLERTMGNSKEIIQKHYQGIISETEIAKFFALTPAVIQAEIDKSKEVKDRVKQYLKPSAKKRVAEYLDKFKTPAAQQLS